MKLCKYLVVEFTLSCTIVAVNLTGILLKMGAYGAKGLTPINFKTMYYEVSLWYMNAFKKF